MTTRASSRIQGRQPTGGWSRLLGAAVPLCALAAAGCGPLCYDEDGDLHRCKTSDDDDDASDDDSWRDDDASDDDTSDDDSYYGDDDSYYGDDDSFVTIVQEGNAELAPPGGPYQLWRGDEVYHEYIGASTTCDISYVTDGVGSGWCDFCEFGFDVVYTVVFDHSTAECLYVYAPGDAETWQMGYYNYYGYGFMLYYAGGYGAALWGYATVGSDEIDYYYAGYYY